MLKRPMVLVGVVLAVLGLIGLVVGGIPWTETHSVSLGPMEMVAEVEEERAIPPLLAGLVLAAGIGLAVYGATRKE